jgi:pimeloyl-ACP methyl ester carboxylesterase
MQSPPSFGEARDAIRAAIARDANDQSLEAVALPRLYEHGGPVEHAVILFHGFTSCPQQCEELARGFYARGCNAYVPRLPRHGIKDRLTRDLANLTLSELQGSAEEAFRLARGLGRCVSAIGISLGATLALWLAQTRPVDLAVPVAPFLMPIGIPRRPGMIAMHLLYRLPDTYWWWDPRVKENCRPAYAYPGYPTHGLAQCVFLGDAVFEEASKKPPLGRRCTLVTNAHESAVNDNVARRLLDLWRRQRADYSEVVLRGLGEPRHDVIDPTTFPQGRTLVYPRLEALVLDGA